MQLLDKKACLMFISNNFYFKYHFSTGLVLVLWDKASMSIANDIVAWEATK